MAYWRHRTKTGRVVYDRPKNRFRLSDITRIVKRLEKPYLVVPRKAWDELFRPEPAIITGEATGYFGLFLDKSVESPYLLDVGSIDGTYLPGVSWMVLHGAGWRRAVCACILAREHVTIVRSRWIEG